jgi:hypothetical protein
LPLVVSALTLESTEKFHWQLECGCTAAQYSASRGPFKFRSRYLSPHLIEPVQVHDIRPIVSSLSDATKATQRALRSVRLCASVGVEFVKPIHYSFILQAEVKFSENRASCAEFLRGCIRYGTAVVMACTAFASYSPFSRTRNSQDLVDRATRLATERAELSAQPSIQMRGAFLHLVDAFW